MPRIPTEAGRVGSVNLLAALLAHPPEGFDHLAIQKGEQTIDRITWEDLEGATPEDLFESHLELHGDEPGRIRYRIKVRGDDGKLVPGGVTKAWGLKRATTSAQSARQAGGGGEAAAAALGDSSAAAMRQLAGLVPTLAKDAAGANREQLETMAEHTEFVLENQKDNLIEMMGLQATIAQLKAEAAMRDKQSFWQSAAGMGVAGGLAEALPQVVPALVGFLTTWTETRKLDNRAALLELQELETVQLERRAAAMAQMAAAQEASSSYSAPENSDNGGSGTSG